MLFSAAFFTVFVGEHSACCFLLLRELYLWRGAGRSSLRSFASATFRFSSFTPQSVHCKLGFCSRFGHCYRVLSTSFSPSPGCPNIGDGSLALTFLRFGFVGVFVFSPAFYSRDASFPGIPGIPDFFYWWQLMCHFIPDPHKFTYIH